MRLNKPLAGIPVTLAFASAYGVTDDSHPFSLAAGWALLTNNTAARGVGPSGFIVEGSYRFSDSSVGSMLGPSTATSIDLTYDHFNAHGNSLNQYAILVAGRTNLASLGSSGFRPYAGLGIGLVDNAADVTIAGASGGSVHRSPDQVNFAAKGILGAHITDNIFIEAAYRYNGTVLHTVADTFTVTLGVRF